MPRIKDGEHIKDLDEYKSIEGHSIALHINGDNSTYLDIFEVERIPNQIKEFIRNKNIKTNNYRIQANESIMCECLCILFIDFMLQGKSLLDYSNKYEKNHKIILKYFQ